MSPSTSNSAIQEELYPTKRWLHCTLDLFSWATCGTALAMIVGQILGMIFKVVGPIQYVLRIYVIALCVLVILNEWEWTIFTRESKILRIWVTRGLFYAFIGLLGLEENDTSTTYQHTGLEGFSVSLVYIKVIAWVMVGCGALYFGMGIVCLQFVYTRMQNEYQQRQERAKTLRNSRTVTQMQQRTQSQQPPPSSSSSPQSQQLVSNQIL